MVLSLECRAQGAGVEAPATSKRHTGWSMNPPPNGGALVDRFLKKPVEVPLYCIADPGGWRRHER